MQAIISIVFFIAAHFIPSDAQQFVMGVPDGEDITWVKQASGGWRIENDTKNQVGTWSVNGTSLIGNVQGRKLSNDMSKGLSISPDTDWNTISQIDMGKETFHIQRSESGVTISHRKESATGEKADAKYRITWTAPETRRAIDLQVGTIQLPPGFSEKRTGTIDSRRGEIARNNPYFVITYDIGAMSGLHMHPNKKSECVWFTEQTMGDQKCYMGMEQRGTDRELTISIVPSDGQPRGPWKHPANFWAQVRTDEDIEDLKQIAMSYLPKSEK